ncbi:MAG: glycosyltransferase family 4 protein [Candidatus Paceibacterota bacterium]
MTDSKNKRILIATPLYPPDIGGPATYTALLERELPKWGFTVSVVNFGAVRHWPKGIRHLVYGWRVFRAARRADIVYAQDPVSVGLPAMLAAKLSRRKFILRLPGDYAWEQGIQRFGVTDQLTDFAGKKSGYDWRVKIMKRVETIVAAEAKQIVVPSRYLKNIVVAWGIPAGKIKVIYNCFDLPMPTSTDNQPNLTENEGKIGPTILSAGRLVPWKGFSALIEIMPTLLDKYPQGQLYIYGEGPERTKLEERIKNLKLSDNVFLPGQLSQAELLAEISRADIFVLNTAYEGFSHLLLEAMVLGRPVIATAVGGNLELIKNGQTGLLIPYNDKEALKNAIINLTDNRSLAKQLAMAGRETGRQFSTDNIMSDLVHFLKQL